MTTEDKIRDAKLTTCLLAVVLALYGVRSVGNGSCLASQFAGAVLGVVMTGAVWSFLLREGR